MLSASVDPLFASAPVAMPAHSLDSLALLDDPQEWSAFSRKSPEGPQCWESSVVVEGMYCAACSLAIEDALNAVPGVVSATVSAASKRAKVVWASDRVLPSAWMQAVQQAGYRAVPANDIFSKERRKQETRKALWRWLVAGLCMMQVMMYAYPAYTAQPGDLSAEMERLLRWASWVLSLPVMLFSCGPFFKSALRDLRHAGVSMDLPVTLGILITFAVSSLGTFEPAGPFGHEVYFDSLTMFVFFLLTGRWLELRLRDRTAGALEALMNRLPDSVERRNAQGIFERVAVRRVAAGDLLRVHPGEAFAADGVVETGTTQVDEALLTGESKAVARGQGDRVVAGSQNLSGTVTVYTQSVGAQTQFAQIVALMESASSTKPAGSLLADRLARPFLIAVLLAALGACAWWWPTDPEHALMVAVAVLVVTCPCALSLATPAAMLASAASLAKSGVLVRNLNALETLAHVDTLVFDKTGTLTMDALVLGTVTVREGVTTPQALQMAGALAQRSLHPVSRALHFAAAKAADTTEERRWSCDAVAELAGQGVAGVAHGQRQDSGAESVSLRLGSERFACAGSAPGEGINNAGVDSQLCAFLSDESGWLATFALQEQLRPNAREAVERLRQSGVQVSMLSGDSAASVARVASSLGIAQARGDCAPVDKLSALRALQNDGRTVAMVGDGLNDGPVLAGAHVSFAFGGLVAPAQSRSDFVVLGSTLMSVVDATLRARKTMAVVKQNLWWALLYNAACIPLAIAGVLPAWLAGLGMAMSSLVVVANALRLTGSISTANN
jgi:Cu2+-exporting ATPase